MKKSTTLAPTRSALALAPVVFNAVLCCSRCRCYENVATLIREGEELLCPRCAGPRCKPDTPSGPGRCGVPAAYAVDNCPDWGATWDRTVTLYLCAYHAWVYGANFSEMRCLTCGAEVERGAAHSCEMGERRSA